MQPHLPLDRQPHLWIKLRLVRVERVRARPLLSRCRRQEVHTAGHKVKQPPLHEQIAKVVEESHKGRLHHIVQPLGLDSATRSRMDESKNEMNERKVQ